MRAVEVRDSPAPRTIAAISPSGVRIEGLTLDDVVALVRALG